MDIVKVNGIGKETWKMILDYNELSIEDIVLLHEKASVEFLINDGIITEVE